MLEWKVVDAGYLAYLRKHEKRIPFSEYGKNKYKPFFGELFRLGDLAYVTQVSHPQSRHKTMKGSLDFHKVYHPDDDRLIAVVNLNYMFPIPLSILETLQYKDIGLYRDFRKEEEKSKYINLLKKEMKEINTLGLSEKSLKIYDIKNNHPKSKISKRCFDFQNLEVLARDYNKESR